MGEFNVAKTGQSRVFLIEWRARGDRVPKYMNAMRAGALSAPFGDSTPIKIPSDDRYDAYVEIDEIQGEEDRPTLSLEGRYARDLKSTLLKLGRQRCPFDVQVHIGTCTDPRAFDQFEKAVILEGAKVSTYNTEDLGSLEDGDQNPVNENVDLSAKIAYEVLPMSYSKVAETTVTVEIVDVFIGDTQSCGDCESPSDGCSRIFALSLSAGGSPSTPADIICTLDKWDTHFAHDIETLAVGENPAAGDVLGSYVIVVSNDSASQHIALVSEFDGSTDPVFTEVATGYVAGGEPNAIKSVGSLAFVVGDAGYIYKITDPASGVTVLDAGVAVTDNLNAVDALSDTFAVAVGNSGAVVKTENGTNWESVTPRPVGAGVNLNGVAVKSTTEWWVVSSDGNMYVTYNAGQSWKLKEFPGSGTGVCRDIVIATDSVFFLSHDTTAPLGRILQSVNGGNSWVVLPRGVNTIAANDRFNSIAPCEWDPNSITAGGLADNGTDGVIVFGQAAE